MSQVWNGIHKYPQLRRLTTVQVSDGPLDILQKKIDDNTLLPDDHQKQVVNDLQILYEKLKDYEPKAPAGNFSKWFSFGQSQKKSAEPDIRGLYIYGSVGGGKTMLMDMFFDCCQVFDLESIFANQKFTFVFFPRLILDAEEEASSLQFIHD